MVVKSGDKESTISRKSSSKALNSNIEPPGFRQSDAEKGQHYLAKSSSNESMMQPRDSIRRSEFSNYSNNLL